MDDGGARAGRRGELLFVQQNYKLNAQALYIRKKAGVYMAVPTFEDMMEPMLRGIKDGEEYRASELEKIIAERFSLTEDDLNRRMQNGNMTQVRHRLTWAKSYLKKAGLVDSPAYGVSKITEGGLKVLEGNPERIDRRFLEGLKPEPTGKIPPVLDPVEKIMSEVSEIEGMLKDNLLEKMKALSPRGFEIAVLDLCKKMSGADVEHTGKPGDGGVDGIIHDSKFGLSKIYVQAKRHASQVSKSQVMQFMGAVSGKSTRNGIFITTAEIPKSAGKETEENKNVSIKLVDGNELAELMLEYNVGVAVEHRLEIKKIVESYFDELGSEPYNSRLQN